MPFACPVGESRRGSRRLCRSQKTGELGSRDVVDPEHDFAEDGCHALHEIPVAGSCDFEQVGSVEQELNVRQGFRAQRLGQHSPASRLLSRSKGPSRPEGQPAIGTVSHGGRGDASPRHQRAGRVWNLPGRLLPSVEPIPVGVRNRVELHIEDNGHRVHRIYLKPEQDIVQPASGHPEGTPGPPEPEGVGDRSDMLPNQSAQRAHVRYLRDCLVVRETSAAVPAPLVAPRLPEVGCGVCEDGIVVPFLGNRTAGGLPYHRVRVGHQPQQRPAGVVGERGR